jgi:hypothetical protein
MRRGKHKRTKKTFDDGLDDDMLLDFLDDPRWDMGDILNDPMFDCLDELLDRPNLLSLLSRS